MPLQTASTTLPRHAATAGIDRGPILVTTHLESGHTVTAMGWTYVLAKPAAPDPTHPLVLVRIDRANPREAEVFRLGIASHTYLGTARRDS